MAIPDNSHSELVPEDQEIGRRLRRLTILRLVLAPLGFGMTIAAVVNLIIAAVRAFSGDFSHLKSLLPFFLIAGAFTALSAAAIPRIDRRILDIASRAPGKAACLQMLNLAVGLPLGKNRLVVEAELARQLSEVDDAWWAANAKELREQVNAALEVARHPSWIHPMDGPWVPALLQAVSRCGRTEYIRSIESLTKLYKKKDLPRPILEAAEASLEVLRIRQQKDREAATLLRPSVSADEYLLHPVLGNTGSDSGLLLRPEPVPETAEQTPNFEVPPSSEPAALNNH